jgi:hypothetical protein
VFPSTQNPVPSVVLAQTQEDPGPQAVKVLQVSPVQELLVQALFLHSPDVHYRSKVSHQGSNNKG